MNFKKLGLLCASTMLFGVISGVALNRPQHQYVVEGGSSSFNPTTTYTNHDADTYYNGISDSLTGTQLLTELQKLNSNRRKKTVGYDPMGTSPAGAFRYTDYDTSDPSSVKTDSNGQPYGTYISSFYTYTKTTSWNREHVWPNSHGGGKKGSVTGPYIDADIHMPRPTISSENSSRGNSYFVEGMDDDADGWDPYKAGYSIESRGEAARISMYCVVADSRLELTDKNKSTTPDNKMGNIETILKWNLDINVTQREKNRNEGAEYLQGNRNPFIDHPEYACRIWGNYNDKTKQICSGQKTIEIYTSGVKAQDIILTPGLDKSYTLKVDGTATSDVTWSLENQDGSSYLSDALTLSVSSGTANIHTVKDGSAYLKASYSYVDGSENKTITSRIKITVETTPVVTSLEVKNAKTNYIVGDEFEAPKVVAHYSNGSEQEVTASFTGYNMNVAGEYTVTVSYQGITTSFDITVNARPVKTVTSIEVTDARLGYKVGDSFQKPIVTAYYNDNSKKEVTDSCTFEGFDSSKAVDETITVIYTENGVTVQTTYQINIKYAPSSIEVTSARLGYKVGDSFQTPIVTAYYYDGSKKEVTDSCVFEGFDSSEPKDLTITVKYTENNVTVQTTYQIRINNPDTPAQGGGGCGGDVATTSIVLASVSLSLVTLILISKLVRKKKEN